MALPDWTRDPDALERVFLAALSKGDAKGVEAALTLMAPCDPDRAQRLYDELTAAVHIAKGGEYRIAIVPVGDRP